MYLVRTPPFSLSLSPMHSSCAVIMTALIACAAPVASAQPPAGSSPISARPRREQQRLIDSLVRDAIATPRLSSVAVAVVQGTDTIALHVAGLAERSPDRVADRSTVYRLASITKQFTAAMVLQLVDEHRLALTDTLGAFLSWVPSPWRAVSIAQLLNHTSGIPSYTSLGPAWRTRMAEDMSPDTIIALSVGQPLDFPPGTAWRYDNTGFVILGRIVELLEHQSYAASVQRRLAQPLGLSSLQYCRTQPVSPHDAAGYERISGGLFRPGAPLSLTQPFAAGALCASVLDVVRWNRALHGGVVVSASQYARLTTPEGPARAAHYGFGIGRDSAGGRLRFLHSGGINGFSSNNSYWPDSALSIVVLANTDGNDVDALAEQLRRVVMREALLPRPRVIALTSRALDRHVGRYALSLPGRTLGVVVRRDGTRLVAAFDGESPTALAPIAAHRFMAVDDETLQLEFIMTAARATSVVLHSGPQTFTGRRVNGPP